jgi:lambda family phage tail tape measure protein
MSDAAKDLDSSSIGDKFKSTMGEIRAEATIVSQEAANMLEHLGLGWKEASKLQEEMEDVKDYALGVTEADMEAGIRAAAAAAAVLAEKMGISLGLALELVALAGKSKAENAFDASVSTGRFPAGAKGDFNVEGGDTPVALQSYLDRVDARVKARAAAARKSRGGGGSAKAKGEKDPLGDLLKRIELDTKLLGVSEERAEVMRKLGDDASKYNQDEVDAVVNRLGLYNQEKEALELVQNTQQSIADTLKSSMSEAFMSMVDGTKSFKDAMKDMAKSVIKQLFDILVVQRLVGSFDSKSGKGTGLVGAIMGALPFANGGAFSSGSQIQAYADGGVVGGPTMFPMSGGKTGLMGEAGPEAIMPLKRGKNGKLGVETSGSGSVVVNNNFNIAANGDESVKRIIQGEMPKISEATKRAVVDSKRRGGSYGRSF